MQVPDFVAVWGHNTSPKCMIPFQTFWDYYDVTKCTMDPNCSPEAARACWAEALPLCGATVAATPE